MSEVSIRRLRLFESQGAITKMRGNPDQVQVKVNLSYTTPESVGSSEVHTQVGLVLDMVSVGDDEHHMCEGDVFSASFRVSYDVVCAPFEDGMADEQMDALVKQVWPYLRSSALTQAGLLDVRSALAVLPLEIDAAR